MNARRSTLAMSAVLAAAALFILSPKSRAKENDPVAPRPAGATTQPADEMAKMPMMARMEAMAKLKAVLEEAKGAAEAEKATTAGAKIAEALRLLDQEHQAMHQQMAQMMQKMKEKMAGMKAMEQECQKMKEEMGKKEETKPMQAKMDEMMKKMEADKKEAAAAAKAGEMKCPMCGKMMSPKAEGASDGT